MLGGKEPPVDMSILVADIGVAEKPVRSGVRHAFLLVAFRSRGGRQLDQLSATVLLLNLLVAYVTLRFKRADRVIEPAPALLVRHGRILRQSLRREYLGPHDLRASLRHHGLVSVRNIRCAFLAEDGPVSVIAGRARGE
jgi:hypothetical protein